MTACPRWPHQEQAFRFAKDRSATLLNMDMGTGKTRVAIDLLRHWRSMATLILCPKTVIPVWPTELDEWARDQFDVLCLDGNQTIAKKAVILKKFREVESKPKIIVGNYELSRSKFFRQVVCSLVWDAVILDESHRAKGPKTITSNMCRDIRRVADRRLCLTGTALADSPLDIYGQCRFLDPSIFGGLRSQDWWTFRARYAVTRPMDGVYQGIVVGYRNLDNLQAKLSQIAFRVLADEVLDLPEKQEVNVPIMLTGRSAIVYKEFERDFVAQVNTGAIVASNALTHLLRLQQLTSGCAVDENGVMSILGDDKKQWLVNFLQDLPEKESVVVFCRFTNDLTQIKAAAAESKRRYREVSGRVKELDGNKMVDDPGHVLGTQIQAGGLGINLTRARYVVFWNTGVQLSDFLQAMARAYRAGQDRTVFFYYLTAVATVDVKVTRALRRKEDVIKGVVNQLPGVNGGV